MAKVAAIDPETATNNSDPENDFQRKSTIRKTTAIILIIAAIIIFLILIINFATMMMGVSRKTLIQDNEIAYVVKLEPDAIFYQSINTELQNTNIITKLSAMENDSSQANNDKS